MNPKNRNYIISIKCIGFASKTILPMLLVFRVNILNKWSQYKNLDNNIVISKTKTGYANNNTMLE